MSAAPSSVLDRLLQQKVILQLKDGRQFLGTLQGSDDHLNVVLDDAEERSPAQTRRLGRVVLRGSNVLSLHAPSGSAPSKGA